MFKNLLIIENNLKSIFSYQLSKKYGYREKDYLNIKNFTNDPTKAKKVKDLVNKMKRQISINGFQHNATIHYISKYGYVPLWVLVKVLSFGVISDLYSILKPDDKVGIASIYNISIENLESFYQYYQIIETYVHMKIFYTIIKQIAQLLIRVIIKD